MRDLDKYKVFVFSTGERTSSLSRLCFEKLGFKDIVFLEGNSSFSEKYLDFAKQAIESNSEFFIRSDADILVFEGMLRMVDYFESNPDLSNLTGVYFDCIMNNFRGGTPHIFKRDVLEFLLSNSDIIKNSQKPESDFGRAIEAAGFACKSVNIFTNLHEFEQYPSKICNAFLNRLSRNHAHLYDSNHLNNLRVEYRLAIDRAIEFYNKNGAKSSMSFINFDDLDTSFSPIKESELETLYDFYSTIYRNLLTSLEA